MDLYIKAILAEKKRSSRAMETEDNSLLSPEVLGVMQALEDYRFEIHACIYRTYFYGREIKAWQKELDINCKMVSEGFPPVLKPTRSEETGSPPSLTVPFVMELIQQLKKLKRSLELRISSLEHQRPYLRSYIDSNKRAVELDFKIRQLVDDSEFEIFSGRWDIIFINSFEALRLKTERDKIFPLWDQLKRRGKTVTSNDDSIQFMNKFNNYNETYDREVSAQITAWFTKVRDEFNRKHLGSTCDHYKFHCQFLDDEIANMLKFMIEHCTSTEDIGLSIEYDDEVNLTMLQNIFENPYPLSAALSELGGPEPITEYMKLSMKLSNLKYYRACLDNQENRSADEWMRFRFDDNFDSKEARFLIQRTKRILRRKPRRRADRIELNGRHEGVSSSYRLPVLRTTPIRSSEKPWWVKQLRTSQEEMDQVKAKERDKMDSCDSQAATVLPPQSSTTARSTKVRRDQLQREASETNRQAANYYRDTNRLSDHEMCTIPMCPVHLNLTECLKIKWKDCNGSNRERSTNFVGGGMYHCRSFSYDALNNEWLGRDDYCLIKRQLDVTQDGAFRVPIVGESGLFRGVESIFKVYKDRGDHRIDRYLADARSQSVAAHYVDRFRERTGDKFGCLRMLNLEVIMVFDSLKRQKIIEIMTCESHVESEEKSPLKYHKFTNNWIFKHGNRKIDMLEAFSHFSYEESDGVLMVTDLQGFYTTNPRHNLIYNLTDPVVHYQSRRVELFGSANFGEEGMRAFFAGLHKECNKVCRDLGLKRPDWENPEKQLSSSLT